MKTQKIISLLVCLCLAGCVVAEGNGFGSIFNPDDLLLISLPGDTGTNTGTDTGTATGSALTYTVSGTISGLSGTVIFQNNATDDLDVTSDGVFTFVNELSDDAVYNVTALAQPSGQNCAITNASGTIAGAAVTDVSVDCNDSGTLDVTFNGKGYFTHDSAAGGNDNDDGQAVAVQSDGKMIVAGYSVNANSDMAVWRLNTDGSLDATFGTNGYFTHDNAAGGLTDSDQGYAIALQSDGKILVAGVSANGFSDMAVWRLWP